jgi:hypothetical protein
MREIKFRGYTEQERLNKWVYGSLVVYNSGNVQIVTPSVAYFVDPKSVGQLIAKFKDSPDLYEGDILECFSCAGESVGLSVVRWCGGDYPAYDIDMGHDTDGMNGIHYLINYADFNIVGNNYENPELLEK